MDPEQDNWATRLGDRLSGRLFALADSLQGYSVEVPWDAEVCWPDRCTRCHAPDPATTFPTHLSRPRALTVAFNFSPPWAQRRLVCPSCEPCREAVRRQMRLSVLIPFPTTVAMLLSGIWVMSYMPYISVLTPILRIGIILFAIALGIGLALAIGDPISTTVTTKTITFEFQDAEAAERFAEANGVSVIEPEPIFP